MKGRPLKIRYFGALGQAAGLVEEARTSSATDCRALWIECALAHGLERASSSVRVALDGQFVAWDAVPEPHSEVAFMPPFAGG